MYGTVDRLALHLFVLLPHRDFLRFTIAQMSAAARLRLVVVDPFCKRQFDAASGKGPFINCRIAAFEEHIAGLFEDEAQLDQSIKAGYAPFCKHLFVPNFASATVNELLITPENEGLLRSGYSARTEKELPVLTRFFPADAVGTAPEAKFLDLILYSREQIKKENAAMGGQDSASEDAPWGIVSIKAQDVDHELPMQPITMMRNTMISEGGSGEQIDRAAYDAAVAYWSTHAPIQCAL